MNIQTRNYGVNQVVISTKDLEKLIELAEKVEPIKLELEDITLSSKEMELLEDKFAQELLAEGFISNIPMRDETDEDDNFELIELEGEPLSEQIIRERR